MMRNTLLRIFGGGTTLALALLAAISTVTVTSCAHYDEFAVDSIVVDRSWAAHEAMENDELGGRSYYYALVDYPANSENLEYNDLADSVRFWISTMLLPAGNEPVMTRRVLEEAVDIFFGEVGGNEWGANKSVVLRKVYEDREFLSYDATEYTYYGGAAHGMYHVGGATFRKESGHRLAWTDIQDRDHGLRLKLTESMMKELGLASTTELMATLLTDDAKTCELADGTKALPLPSAEPWLTEDGWVFSYQPYEIMCWAAGAPACRLDKDEVSLN